MNNLENCKQLLSKNLDNTQAKKLLSLIEHYEREENKPALEKLVMIVKTYIYIKDDKVIFNFPENISTKIDILYTKKIATIKFGKKTMEDFLDELIIEA